MHARWWGGGLAVAVAIAFACRPDADVPATGDAGGGGGGAGGPRPTGQVVAAYEGELAFVDGLAPHRLLAGFLAEEAMQKATRPALRAYAAELRAKEAAAVAELKRLRTTLVEEDETPPIDYDWYPALRAGPDFDARWAQAMVRHQTQAIAIIERALAEARDPATRGVAARMLAAERLERDRLLRMAAGWRTGGARPKGEPAR